MKNLFKKQTICLLIFAMLGASSLQGQFLTNPDNGNNLYWTNGGVSIGTTSTGYKLRVKGDNSSSAALFESTHIHGLKDGVISTTSVGLNTSSGYQRSLFKANFNGNLGGYAYNTFRNGIMTHSVDAYGQGYFSRIGIGTHSYAANLNIYNSGTSSSLFMQNGSSGRFWIATKNNSLQIGGVSGSLPSSGAINIDLYGNVGVGTLSTSTGYKLSVNGKIRAKEIKVETGWADFVFKEDYCLRTIEDVEAFIAENGHLPDVPNEAEVADEGIELGEMNALLLQKIEEMTLYIIDLQKQVNELKEQVK